MGTDDAASTDNNGPDDVQAVNRTLLPNSLRVQCRQYSGITEFYFIEKVRFYEVKHQVSGERFNFTSVERVCELQSRGLVISAAETRSNRPHPRKFDRAVLYTKPDAAFYQMRPRKTMIGSDKEEYHFVIKVGGEPDIRFTIFESWGSTIL